MKHAFIAGAGSFAHLIGLRPSGKKAEGDDTKPDDKKDKKAEDEKDDADASEEDDEEEQASDDDADTSEEDHEEEQAEDDSDDKKAKGAKGKTYAAGRADERKRCAAIFASPAAANQPHVAAKLAFTTNLSAKEAIGVLAETASSAPQGKRGLGQRMETVPNPTPGADGSSAPDKDSAEGIAARMTAVYDRATGATGKK